MNAYPRFLAAGRKWPAMAMLVVALGQAVLTGCLALVCHRLLQWYGAGEMRGYSFFMVPAGLIVLLAFLRWVEYALAEVLGQSYVHDIRLALFRHMGSSLVMSAPNKGRGTAVLRFAGDLTSIRLWVSRGCFRLASCGLMCVSCLGLIIWFQPVYGVILAGLLAMAACTLLILRHPFLKQTRAMRRARAHLASDIFERFDSIMLAQTYGRLHHEEKLIRKLSRRLAGMSVRRARIIAIIRAMSEGFGPLAFISIIAASMTQQADREATLASLLPVLLLLNVFTTALKEGFRAYELYFPFHVSRDRIRAKLATRPALRQRRQSPDFSATSADLQLDNLILKSGDTAFSAQIPLGCRIALTGPSGAGKSLLLETLAGLRLQYKGNILVGGHDLDHYNTASVRKIFGFCSPRLPIPRGKPKKLLSYRHPQTDVAQRQAACAWAGLEDESRELVKGNILSRPAGLQLRMKLARALLGMPRILLLDEMDAGADEKYLATLQHLLKAYPGTVIFVAHHPALTAAADEVWQFDNGRIDVKKRATQPQIRIAG